jgi:hypothetical protein
VAEWLRSGLQSRLHRFDSGRRLLPTRLGVALAFLLAGCVVSACGSTAAPERSTTTAAPAPVSHKPRRHTPRQLRLGTTQRVRAAGATLSVTVSRVINPLAGSGAALAPRTRAVGVVVRIQNHGPGVYDSSATGDVSVVPASGSAMPVFARRGVCQTPLRDFDNYITAGEVRHGCVPFSVEAGAKLLAVRFSPHGHAAGRATWAVGR